LGRFANVFVAGDVTYVPGEDEKLCQDAIASAYVVADNIYKLHYSPNKGLSRFVRERSDTCHCADLLLYRRYLPCKRPMVISLGQYDGIFTYYGWTLTGFIPACVKEGIEWKEMLGFQQLWRPPTVPHLHAI
jgi:NADH dehydrogenase FAD-containing subunit